MKQASRVRAAGRRLGKVALLVSLGAGLAFAWPWSKDMMWTPVLAPFEQAMRTPPEGTVPAEAGELPARVSEVENPFEPTAENLERGRQLFLTYCAVCHGRDARGEGTVGEAFLLPGFDLTSLRPESYMYERVRTGGAFMPSYREALSPRESWLIVTYVRSLQE